MTCTYKINFANTNDDNFDVFKCYNIHMLTVKLIEKDAFNRVKLIIMYPTEKFIADFHCDRD